MRRLALLAAVLVLCVPAPASAATATAEGESTTSVDLGGIAIGGLFDESLGSADVLATTADQTPLSLAGATLPGGERVEVSSADETDVPAQSVSLPGLGEVRLGGLTADANEDSATALLEALQAELSPLGLTIGTQDGGALAGAGAEGTGANTGVVVSGLSITLDDLLGDDLLAELPLGVLLELGDLLGLDLAGLGADQLADLVDELEAGATLAAQVDAARAALNDALATVDDAEQELAAAQATATAAAAAVTAQQQTITDLQNQIGGLGCAVVAALCAQLTDAQTQLTTLQAAAATATQAVTTATEDLADAQAALQPLQDAVDALVAEVNALLDRLTQLLAGVDSLDLTALLEQLRAALDGLELVGVDALRLSVATSASADDSGAEVSCAVGDVRIAGQAVGVDACRDLSGVLATATQDILSVLGSLPLDAGQLAELPELVTLTPPALDATDADATQDGAQFARASATGLGIDVAALDLADLASEDLLAPVTAFVDGALPDLGALPGVNTSVVTAALDDLLAQVDTLPLGDLAGLSTPSLRMAPAGIVATSQFGAAGLGPVTPTGQTGSPGGPSDSPGTLPATGGGIGVGLVLLAAGAGTLAWMRRPRGSM